MEPNHRFWFNIILNKIPKFSKLNKLSAVGKFASLYILNNIMVRKRWFAKIWKCYQRIID